MRGYFVFDIEIIDQEKYDQYRKMVPSSLEAYGGKFLVRGGKIEELEGEWSPKRFGILEFDSAEKARAWYDSPEYAPAKALRHQAARSKILIVEGV